MAPSPRAPGRPHPYAIAAAAALLSLLFAFVSSAFAAAGTVGAADGEVRARQFVTSDEIRLSYLEAGEGPRALVLVPGWLMPGEIFAPQLSAFPGWRVLAFSPRSQGQSEVYRGPHTAAVRARDIHELVVASGAAGNFVLAGWSLGVMEALDYLHRYDPAGLKGLVLVDNSIGEGAPPAAGARSGMIRELKTSGWSGPFLHRFVRGLFATPQPPERLDSIEAMARRMPPSAAIETLNKPYPREYYRDEIYRHPSLPLFYAVTPRLADQAAALRKRRPDAAVSVYEGAGHALFVDQAERFNAELRAFLEGIR